MNVYVFLLDESALIRLGFAGKVCVSENQMFRNLAGNPQGKGERLRE